MPELKVQLSELVAIPSVSEAGIVAATALATLIAGAYAGYKIGAWKGRPLLERPGRPLEIARRKPMAKGDDASSRGTFFASATLPSFLPGIFGVPLRTFMPVTGHSLRLGPGASRAHPPRRPAG